ncbi:hypothetical protein Sango_2970600 [Sesamum angolense]|uniref:Uncharacterized protein n=1 Tax=Sesamum angolense TaxID=2727404 RepID=A0AAE1VUJ6_9LAMI|nr:hypothetical protein Sango_2970600 [Sesamum angolense]
MGSSWLGLMLAPLRRQLNYSLKNITKYFGVSQDIISDSDARFTGRFWTALFDMNWVNWLDVAQFSYNLHKSSATSMSPFELAYRQQSLTPHEIPVQKLGERCLVAYQFARSMQELLDEAKDSLAKAQRIMKKYIDMRKRQVEFSVGDQMLLKLTP